MHVDAMNDEKKTIIRVLLESFLIGMLDMQKKYPDVYRNKNSSRKPVTNIEEISHGT